MTSISKFEQCLNIHDGFAHCQKGYVNYSRGRMEINSTITLLLVTAHGMSVTKRLSFHQLRIGENTLYFAIFGAETLSDSVVSNYKYCSRPNNKSHKSCARAVYCVGTKLTRQDLDAPQFFYYERICEHTHTQNEQDPSKIKRQRSFVFCPLHSFLTLR